MKTKNYTATGGSGFAVAWKIDRNSSTNDRHQFKEVIDPVFLWSIEV